MAQVRRPWLSDYIETAEGHTVEYDDHGAVVGLELMGVRRAVESGGELQLTWPSAQVAASAALVEARTRRQRAALREEASRLASDAGDRRELAALAADLDVLAPAWPEE